MQHYFNRLLLLLFLFPFQFFGQQTTHDNTIIPSHECRGLRPKHSHKVDSRIDEGSGLVAWHGMLWTHNDSSPSSLFTIDSLSGKIINEYPLPVQNKDWEELSQDDNFFYLGDIGNNAGNRKRLSIYRIKKEELLQNKIVLDTITFEWPVTGNFGVPEKINFDCEAMTVINDTIFLYTKEFQKHRCSRIFKLPATPKHHTAEYVATIKTRLLITGATYSASTKRVTLCGYNLFLSPRILSFSINCANDFATICDAKETRIKRYLRQIEGIASFDDSNYYLISEATKILLFRNKPKLYKVKSRD